MCVYVREPFRVRVRVCVHKRVRVRSGERPRVHMLVCVRSFCGQQSPVSMVDTLLCQRKKKRFRAKGGEKRGGCADAGGMIGPEPAEQ